MKFRNPFRSNGVTQPANRVLVGPMRREGITSVENAERARKGRYLNELANAGIMKQMQELGIIPDDAGVDMSDYVGDTVALESGVSSLRNLEKKQDIARQVERFNAGILDEDQRELKQLSKLMKKRKKAEARQKIVQWLAESDELDEVPAEYQEAVQHYYDTHTDANGRQDGAELKRRIEEARRTRKAREEAEADQKRLAQGYWNRPRVIVEPTSFGSRQYQRGTTVQDLTDAERAEAERQEGLRRAAEQKRLRRAAALQAELEDYDLENFFNPDNMVDGNGVINSGWRAPRLHKLVRPLKRFEMETTPDKIVEEQKQSLDDRRDMYKELQTFQRGTAPPKDMVERAMPTTAEPYISIPHKIKNTGIILHPYVFPHKKYIVQKGI